MTTAIKSLHESRDIFMAEKDLLREEEEPNHYGLALAFYALGFIYKNFT